MAWVCAMTDRMQPPFDDNDWGLSERATIGAGSGESPASMEPPIHILAREAMDLCRSVTRTLPWHRRLRLVIPQWRAERVTQKLEREAADGS